MKKLTFLLIALLSTIPSFADDPGTGPIIVIPPTGDGGGNKGNGPFDFVEGEPHVWFDSASSCFIVNISSLETTTLTVENASGSVVAQFPVTADGTSRLYPVTPLPTGIYLVTLENVEESHTGFLLIP